jgi:hypothetical protein
LLDHADEKAKDQPHFTLLAQDNFRVHLVEQWIQSAIARGTSKFKINEAERLLRAITRWRKENRDQCKIPD